MAARLDQVLVTLGLATTRARAAAMIAEGLVSVGGQPARKSSQKADPGSVALTGAPNPWVSRAALKLVHALDHFGLTPGGVAADIGASTGGFTQVLLDRGAGAVWAVDVGHGQIHADIAADPRVTLRERTNARHMDPADLPAFDWVVSDVSFISATLALTPALAAARPGARLVTLIKPQFESEKRDIGKGGIIRDAAVQARAVDRVTAYLTAQGWRVEGVCDSPITGADGNAEFLASALKLPPEAPRGPAVR